MSPTYVPCGVETCRVVLSVRKQAYAASSAHSGFQDHHRGVISRESSLPPFDSDLSAGGKGNLRHSRQRPIWVHNFIQGYVWVYRRDLNSQHVAKSGAPRYFSCSESILALRYKPRPCSRAPCFSGTMPLILPAKKNAYAADATFFFCSCSRTKEIAKAQAGACTPIRRSGEFLRLCAAVVVCANN